MEDWFFMPDFQFRINCQIQMKFEGAFFVGDRFIKIHLLENTTCMCKCGVWEVSEVHKSLLSFKTRLLHSVLLHFCWFTELADCNIQNPHSVSSRNMTEECTVENILFSYVQNLYIIIALLCCFHLKNCKKIYELHMKKSYNSLI